MLTDAKVRTAKAGPDLYRLKDTNGLFLYVSTTGRKTWRYHYEWLKKNQTLTFGVYPDMGLEDARTRRKWARSQLDAGRNPSVMVQVDKAASKYAANNTFELIAREWHERKKLEWVPVHADDVMESLVTHVFPYIGPMPVRDVTAPLLLEVLQRIEARPAIETAKRVRQRMSAIFGYAIATGRSGSDPSAHLGQLLSPLRRGRQPAMRTLEECRAMLQAVEASPASPVTRLAMRFLALTAVRPGVVIRLPWLEVHQLDDENPVWIIPPNRMKLRLKYKDDEAKAHPVPLSRQAVEVLETVHKLTNWSPYAFPNDRNKYKPMSENALGYLLNRTGYYRRHVPHGWRASFSTVMNERRPADRHVIDKMLAHVGKDEVEAAYNRAEHMELRREISQEWADILLEGMQSASSLLVGFRYNRFAGNPIMDLTAPPAPDL